MKLNVPLFVSFSLLAACGAKESKKGDRSINTPIYDGPTFSLIGINETTWEGSCDLVKDRENRSNKTFMVLAEHTFTTATTYFDGLECATAQQRVTFHSQFYNARKDPSERLPGWTTIAYTIEAIQLEIHREVMVLQYNHRSNYGYNNWNISEKKEISGRQFDNESEKELAKDDVRERTLKVDGDELYFARYDGNTPVETKDNLFKKLPQ